MKDMNVPDECWVLILVQLSIPDLCSVGTVNRHLHILMTDDTIWADQLSRWRTVWERYAVNDSPMTNYDYFKWMHLKMRSWLCCDVGYEDTSNTPKTVYIRMVTFAQLIPDHRSLTARFPILDPQKPRASLELVSNFGCFQPRISLNRQTPLSRTKTSSNQPKRCSRECQSLRTHLHWIGGLYALVPLQMPSGHSPQISPSIWVYVAMVVKCIPSKAAVTNVFIAVISIFVGNAIPSHIIPARNRHLPTSD